MSSWDGGSLDKKKPIIAAAYIPAISVTPRNNVKEGMAAYNIFSSLADTMLVSRSAAGSKYAFDVVCILH
jgi:hypothetical protein